jgi:uncharacterized lipoprotein YddW (UPF0748 family)
MLLLLTGCASLRPAQVQGEAHSPGRAVPDVPPPIPRELRAVWVATVSNIDWPSRPGLPAQQQQAELRAILDRAAELNLNAVILQVRPAADALYASPHEPWSEYLTGEMGRAPVPFYDPLAFAVEEAHQRGLELHAWFNPYRARHPSAKSEIAPTHISRIRPELVGEYGKHLWMDPGEEDVQRQTIGVVLDVVRRYDIDGVHIDDYFYPYRERDTLGNEIPFPDDRSWQRYVTRGGQKSRSDWRRNNVDILVWNLYQAIRAEKPHVKFGISPFGIWRPGHPEQIQGFDAYEQIYADARRWLREGWVDYFTPQLYWPIAQTDQSYPVLLRWWVEQNTWGRHLWPGNFTNRVADGERNWPASEIMEQIALTRADPGAAGNIHFSARSLMQNRGGVADLLRHVYETPALVPASTWLDHTPPAAPGVIASPGAVPGEMSVALSPGNREEPWLWTVRTRWPQGWTTEILPGQQRLRTYRRGDSFPSLPDLVVVSAVDRSGNEGPAAVVEVGPAVRKIQ